MLRRRRKGRIRLLRIDRDLLLSLLLLTSRQRRLDLVRRRVSQPRAAPPQLVNAVRASRGAVSAERTAEDAEADAQCGRAGTDQRELHLELGPDESVEADPGQVRAETDFVQVVGSHGAGGGDEETEGEEEVEGDFLPAWRVEGWVVRLPVCVGRRAGEDQHQDEGQGVCYGHEERDVRGEQPSAVVRSFLQGGGMMDNIAQSDRVKGWATTEGNVTQAMSA
ncbi:hypothetical protein L1887_55562 [Cichorium endivia]|nr:hypothetical protein L1887_55562 [Cichorium endivia]